MPIRQELSDVYQLLLKPYMDQYNVLIPHSDEDSPFGDLPVSTSLDASAKLMATNDLVSLSKNFERAITRHILFSFPSSFMDQEEDCSVRFQDSWQYDYCISTNSSCS